MKFTFNIIFSMQKKSSCINKIHKYFYCFCLIRFIVYLTILVLHFYLYNNYMKKSQTERAPQTTWIEVPDSLKLGVPFIRATPLRPVGTDKIEYEAVTDRGVVKV